MGPLLHKQLAEEEVHRQLILHNLYNYLSSCYPHGQKYLKTFAQSNVKPTSVSVKRTVWTGLLVLRGVHMTALWWWMICIHIMYFLALLRRPAWETCRDGSQQKALSPFVSLWQPLSPVELRALQKITILTIRKEHLVRCLVLFPGHQVQTLCVCRCNKSPHLMTRGVSISANYFMHRTVKLSTCSLLNYCLYLSFFHLNPTIILCFQHLQSKNLLLLSHFYRFVDCWGHFFQRCEGFKMFYQLDCYKMLKKNTCFIKKFIGEDVSNENS